MSNVPSRFVVIVDDSPEDRELVRVALRADETCRYQFAEASTLALARELIKHAEQPIDLLVLDWRLPDGQGTELVEELGEEDDIPVCPVVMLTGSRPGQTPDHIITGGVQDFFDKSTINPDILPRIARNAIDRHRLLRRVIASERRAEAARLRAEDANRAKSAFLASMSHELRTPLTAVLGLTELLLERCDDAESVRMLEMIHQNGSHLTELMNEILDLAKVEAGRLELELVECSPADLCRELCELLRFRATDHGLRLDVELDPNIPEQVRTDPVRFRQILMNLLSNAIKFTTHGGISVNVTYAGSPRPLLTVRVSDTGTGIAEENLEAIFSPFVQVTSDQQKRAGGTGLGLAISRSLAKALGGDLTVQSRLGEGSTFTLTLEVEPITDSPAKVAESQQNEIPDAVDLANFNGRWSNRRFLIAEDTPANQFLLKTFLRPTQADLTVVENGEEAIAAVDRAAQDGSPFDVILMDMQMPVLNGYEATARIHEREDAPPVIAITAAAMRADRRQCLEAGCAGYISKPIDRLKLLRLIDKLIGDEN